VNVPGASEEARRVKIMNANWIAGVDDEDGGFELMMVTSDDRKHVVAPSPAAMTALVALAQADTVLVWDPADRRLIAANLQARCPGRRTQLRRVPEALAPAGDGDPRERARMTLDDGASRSSRSRSGAPAEFGSPKCRV
jgi:hypothetical protein